MGCSGSKKQMQVDEPGDAQKKDKDQLAIGPPELVGGGKIKAHFGPLEVGGDGVVVKPKFNLGIQGGSIYALAGVRDVRDGMAAEALGMAMKAYSTDGSSLTSVLQNIKAEEKVPGIDDIIEAVPDITAAVLESIGVDLVLNAAKVEGIVYVFIGAGVSAGLYLGWLDTSGYRMVGAEGKVAAAGSLGMSVRAGLHETGKAARITVYLTNVGFDVVVTLKREVKPAQM